MKGQVISVDLEFLVSLLLVNHVEFHFQRMNIGQIDGSRILVLNPCLSFLAIEVI